MVSPSVLVSACDGQAESVDDFYTETKTVYVDFSGGLQRAQIDNYADDI